MATAKLLREMQDFKTLTRSFSNWTEFQKQASLPHTAVFLLAKKQTQVGKKGALFY